MTPEEISRCEKIKYFTDIHPFHYIPFVTINEGTIVNEFVSPDTEPKFIKMKSTKPKDWYYNNHTVKYTTNNSGYRAPEWETIDWKNSIIMFGCSCTFGIGISDEHTIPYILQELTGRPVINLGVPSCSNNFIMDLNNMYTSRFPNPYAVVVNWSALNRNRIYNDQGIFHTGPWNDLGQASDKIMKKINKIWSRSVQVPAHNYMSNKLLGIQFKNLWKGKSSTAEITYFPGTDDIMNCEFVTMSQDARDSQHPRSSNITVAENIVNQLLKQGKI